MDTRFVSLDGKRVRELREKSREYHTQKKLAEAIGVDVGTISRIERNQMQVRRHTAQNLAACLRVELEEIKAQPFLKASVDHDPLYRAIKAVRLEQVERDLEALICGGVRTMDAALVASLPLTLAEGLTQSLAATSIWGDDDPLKGTDPGKYHQLIGEKAIAKVADVRRLHLIREGVENTPAFQQWVKWQKEHNIAVRYRYLHFWVATKSLRDPVDFGLWDGRKEWDFQPDVDPASHIHLASLRTGDFIQDYRVAFEVNWSDAKIV